MNEKRLIDADALISNELIPLTKTLHFCRPKQKKGVVIAIQRIKDYPTVDAVEVVRCKDCRFWDKQSNSAQGRCILSGNYPTGNWFCANGAKMDGREKLDKNE